MIGISPSLIVLISAVASGVERRDHWWDEVGYSAYRCIVAVGSGVQ